MKHKSYLFSFIIAALCAFALWPAALFAQAVSTASDPSGPAVPGPSLPWWANLVIPVAGKYILDGVQWLLPRIPGYVIPIIGPVCGAAISILAGYVTGGSINPTLGLALGLAATGFHELQQGVVGKAAGVAATVNVLLAFCFILGVSGGLQGCATSLQPGGAYSSVALYNADQGESTLYQGLDQFEKFELSIQGTAADTPAIHAQADFIRVNAPKWFASYATARAAYVREATAGNLATLQGVLADGQAAWAITQQYLATSTVK